MSNDTAAWAREHDASFEVEPLTEVLRGDHVQVGFTVRLSARLPMERPQPERREEADAIRARLREILQSLAPPAESQARLEIQPLRTAASLSPESGMQPEIAVEARVFHGRDYFAEVTEGEERKVYAGVRRLAEMGLKERRRRTP